MKVRRRVIVLWGVATGLGAACSWKVSTGGPILHARWSLLVVLALWAVAWLVAAAATFRLPLPGAVVLIVLAAVAIRAVAVVGTPNTSDDVYRYAWDGRVQAHGIDPYAAPPIAPGLSRLRDTWLWPDARGCAALGRPPGCTRINRPSDRTIYPPVAEAWFAAVHAVGGDGGTEKVWQLAGFGVDLVTIGLLLVALRRWRRDVRWVALYALCPAAVFEFVHNAHVDGLAVTLLIGAFCVAIPPARRAPSAWRDVAVGLLIGAAALVKLYPALLLVPVLCLPRPEPWRSLARAGTAAAGLAALAYSPHVLAVGPRVVGYLPGYLREEHYSGGGRFLLAGAVGLGGDVATVAALIALIATITWVVHRRPDAPRAGAVLLVALFLVTTPVQPWYAVSAVALGSLAAWPAPAAVVVAGYPYYFAVILDYRHTLGLGRLCYGAALGVVVAAAAARRLRREHPGQVERPTAVEAAVASGAVPGGVHRPSVAVGVDEGLEPAGGRLSTASLQHRP
ncbi:MAG: DUF2029 domain-containing protein [Acidimicrobiia bacterium]|nr:DUF2029 domain-containing protein [Acidimicrobiia bacterium]